MPCAIFSQEHNNLRFKKIIVVSDTISLDTFSIIPNSILIIDSAGNKISDSLFSVNYPEAKLILKTKSIKQNSEITISYRVFPYNFSETYSHKEILQIEPDESGMINPFMFQYTTQKSNDIFELGGLSKNGSISRGVSFGNFQDVVVNSNFNLQLAGKLNNDIDVLAAITDNNIPIQPEGNTQQIQEFDRVFIQLSKNKTKLIAGDFVLNRPKGYFMNFYKKAQGGLLSTSFALVNKQKKASYLEKKIKIPTLNVSASAAISKGKYAKNSIAGVEGNQGPYKLKGKNNESFIIVLAGTEKVYIDGHLLTRGQSNDYVIDYNTAEIIFTPKNLITKDKRIIIEFEYSDKNYARSLFFVGTEFESKKLNLRFNFFSEQDLSNQPLQQDLSNEQKLLLSNIGDSLNNAIVYNIDSVGFSVNEVLYKMVDTLGYDSVFVYSTNPDSAFFRLGFSNVGQENGDYVQIQSTGNGRVFNWVKPDNGVHQGNFAPVILLVTPKKNQMYTFGADYAFSKNTHASVEMALSENDINTFSNKDNADDIGYAINFNFDNKTLLSKKDTNAWALLTNVKYEWINKDFTPLEPYRNIEFNRDWNITNNENRNDEHLSGLSLTFKKNKIGFINYQLNSFLKGDKYIAFKNMLNTNLNKNGFNLNFSGSYVQTETPLNKSNFLRQKTILTKKLKWITIGLNEEQEQNSFNDIISDSLLNNSFSFFKLEAFVVNPDTTKNKFSFNYKKRYDYLPQNNAFEKSTTGDDFGLTYQLTKNNNRLNLNITYRRLTINDTSLTAEKKDNTIVSRLEYFTKLFKGAITSSTFFEIGSGLEIKKEFTYLEVEPGQGVYYWNVAETDYNGNGVLDLDEVEIAAFQDQANYIRTFIPSNEFEKVYTNQFSESFNLNPAAVWRNKKGFKKFLSRFSNQMVYRINHKTKDDDFTKAYNPFSSDIDNALLMTLNSSFRNTFYFNRSHAKFGMDINYQNNENKILLTNGFGTRTLEKKGVNFRWNISRKFMLNANSNVGKKTSASEYFTSKDYDIHFLETQPSLSFQPNVSFRLTVMYKYNKKENFSLTSISNQITEIHNLGIELKYNIISKGNLLLKVNYIDISYNSPENTSLAFEMLEGLKTGKNATWNVSYQRNLSNHLQLSLVYDGRKSPEVKAVHVGSVQLRAYF